MREIAVASVVAMVAMGCKADRAPAVDRAGAGSGSAPATAIDAAAAPAFDAPDDSDDDDGGGGIRIRFTEPHTGPVAAVRCSLGGDPLAVECGRGPSIAIDGDDRIYAVDRATMRRFTVATATAERCDLALDPTFGDHGVLPQPAIEPPGQELGGDQPVFMASGEPEWRVIAGAGTTMYAVEFMRGVHRIDRGRVEPVCPRLLGVRGIAPTGKDAVIARSGGERVVLGGACKPRAAGLDPKPSLVATIGGAVWGSTSDDLIRYGADGVAAVTAGTGDSFAPGGLCHVAAIAPCGADHVCAIDSNCQKVEIYDRDGTFVHELESNALFATRPYGLRGGAGARDGALWIAVDHKDGATCEGAIYRVATP